MQPKYYSHIKQDISSNYRSISITTLNESVSVVSMFPEENLQDIAVLALDVLQKSKLQNNEI